MPRAQKPELADLKSTGYGDKAQLMRQAEGTPIIAPDDVPNLSAPSSRPAEPVTQGLPMGPGDGPNVMQPIGDPVRRTLRTILLFNPENNAAMRLLDMLDRMGRA